MRHSTRGRSHFRVRLACVKHAASVQSEPESNSPVQICTKISAWQKSESQSSLSTRSSLVNEPEKEFFTPAVFAAFVNMLFCHRFVNNFFGNLQKTFCEGFLKPRCFMRRGRLLRSSLMPVNNFFFFFPEIFFPEPSEKGCFSGGERDVYAFRAEMSISFPEKIKKGSTSLPMPPHQACS